MKEGVPLSLCKIKSSFDLPARLVRRLYVLRSTQASTRAPWWTRSRWRRETRREIKSPSLRRFFFFPVFLSHARADAPALFPPTSRSLTRRRSTRSTSRRRRRRSSSPWWTPRGRRRRWTGRRSGWSRNKRCWRRSRARRWGGAGTTEEEEREGRAAAGAIACMTRTGEEAWAWTATFWRTTRWGSRGGINRFLLSFFLWIALGLFNHPNAAFHFALRKPIAARH